MPEETDDILDEILEEINDYENGKRDPPVVKKSPEVNEKKEKLVNLPISRIKQIMHLDPEVHLVSSESVFLITKAAEMFIETLAKDSYTHTVRSKKKTIQKRDVDAAVSSADSLIFLEGMFDW